GVDAGGGVALEEHLVARVPAGPSGDMVLAPEEMVETDLVEAGAAGVGGDMPADTVLRAVGPADHDRRIPADVGPDPALDVLVAGEPRLQLGWDGVDEVGARQAGHADGLFAGALEELEHQEPGAAAAALGDDRVQGLQPFGGFRRVDVGKLTRQAV